MSTCNSTAPTASDNEAIVDGIDPAEHGDNGVKDNEGDPDSEVSITRLHADENLPKQTLSQPALAMPEAHETAGHAAGEVFRQRSKGWPIEGR